MKRALVLLVACGASNAEIHTAKLASYDAAPAQLLALAEEAARENYQIGARDGDGFATVPRFYSREGGLESAGAGDVVQVRAGSVRVTLHVKVVEGADHRIAVAVTPETFQVVEGSPQPRELKPDDPYLPAFVTGRADALALAIYERAKGYATAPGK
jgi:hypothetical protein